MLEHLFQDYALKKVFVEIDTRNQASLKLIEKLGFIRTASNENADFFKDSVSHEFRYEQSAHGRGNWVLKRLDKPKPRPKSKHKSRV